MALTSNLISWWKLDEATSATRADSVVASANDLADNNNVVQADGILGKCAFFDSTNWLSKTSNASLQTGDIDFTIIAWVWLTRLTPDGDRATIISKYATDEEYQLAATTNGTDYQFRWKVTANGADETIVYASTFGNFAIETWYMLIAEHDSTNNVIKISVNNGTADSVAHAGGVYIGTNSLEVGMNGYGGGGYPWYGNIGPVGFWKRLLTAPEKASLYNSGAGFDYPFSAASHNQGGTWGW